MRQREHDILTVGGTIGLCAAALAGSLMMLFRLAEWICSCMHAGAVRLTAAAC